MTVVNMGFDERHLKQSPLAQNDLLLVILNLFEDNEILYFAGLLFESNFMNRQKNVGLLYKPDHG